MILVDARAGSEGLIAPLTRAGLPVESRPRLDADVYFVGRGEGGRPLSIGIEHKTVSDLVNSLRTSRLQGHQLLTMRGGPVPLFDLCWLVIEGDILYNGQGQLMRRSGRRALRPMAGGMTVSELYKRLLVLHLRGGLNPVYLRARRDTVQWISALYHALTDKNLDQHRSHLAIYTPPGLVTPSQFRHTIGTLPGVGMKMAREAERRFGSIRRAINAGPDAWAMLETVDERGHPRKMGMTTARKLEQALVGESQ